MFLTNIKDGSSAIKSVQDFLSRKIEGDNITLITSTEKLSQTYNLKLFRSSKRAFHKTDIHSYNLFIKHLYFELLGKELIDEITENEIIIQALANQHSATENSSSKYNYSIQMASIVRGLREDGIRAKHLREDLLSRIDKEYLDNKRLEDLITIMTNYEQQLSKLELVDLPLAMEQLTEKLKNDKSLTGKFFLFVHFTSFRAPDIEFIEALSKANNSIVITTSTNELIGPFLGDENFFLMDLKSIGLDLRDDKWNKLEFDYFAGEDGYEASTRKLIDTHNKQFNLISYQNIREEVYGVTKLVKSLLHQKDLSLKPSDICVASRNVSAYSLLFREFFADNKIPANITDRFELSKSPVAIAIIRVLETLINNYDGEAIRNLLDTAFLEVGLKRPERFVYLMKKYRLSNIFAPKSLGFYIDVLNRKIKELNQVTSGKINPRVNKELEELIAGFTSLTVKFREFKVAESYTIDEFIALNKSIIETFDIRKKILELNDLTTSKELSFNERVFYTEKIEKDARALTKYLELLSRLKRINNLVQNRRYSLEELTEKLKSIISITRYQIREKKGYGVDVTSLEQTRGYEYKVKILVGAVEGMMPITFKTDKLIGKLIEDSEKRHYFQEYIQFHEFLNADATYYIFTHREHNSELRISSHFITPIEEIAKVETEKSGLSWQRAIINEREAIISGVEKPTNNIKNRIEEYKRIPDLILDVRPFGGEKTNRRAYSVTQLVNFKDRPYEYFYETLAELENLPTPELYLTRLEIGVIIHSSMEATFNLYSTKHPNCVRKEITSADGSSTLKLIRLSESDVAEIVKLFKIVSSEKIKVFRYQHEFYDIDRDLLIGDDNHDGIMIKWFEETVRKHISTNYHILANEFSFEKTEISLGGKTALFMGKVDRIDISYDLTKFCIIDYKTSETTVRDGMQLAIYARAVQSILKEKFNIEAEPEMLIYDSFRYKSDSKDTLGYSDLLANKSDIDTTINKMIAPAFELIEQIENYDFSKVKNGRNVQHSIKSEYKTLIRD